MCDSKIFTVQHTAGHVRKSKSGRQNLQPYNLTDGVLNVYSKQTVLLHASKISLV